MAQQQANMARQAQAEQRAVLAAAAMQMGNAIQQSASDYQNSIQNQQMINAYQDRTRVLSQPVDVNLNGNINHTIRSY